MDFNMFEELVKNRQSCRSFDSREIEPEVIDKILKLTKLAPSACNSQPWSFIVFTKENATELAKQMQWLGGNKFVSNCPVLVALVEEKANLMERLGERFLGQDFTSIDIGILAGHLVLAAKAAGIDSCIIGSFKEEKLAAFIGIKKRIRLIVALGYASEGYALREKNRKSDGITYR